MEQNQISEQYNNNIINVIQYAIGGPANGYSLNTDQTPEIIEKLKNYKGVYLTEFIYINYTTSVDRKNKIVYLLPWKVKSTPCTNYDLPEFGKGKNLFLRDTIDGPVREDYTRWYSGPTIAFPWAQIIDEK